MPIENRGLFTKAKAFAQSGARAAQKIAELRNKKFPSVASFLFGAVLAAQAAPALATEVSVVFTDAGYGTFGTTLNKANDLESMLALPGISQVEFMQDTASGRFELLKAGCAAQGNDVAVTLRLTANSTVINNVSGGYLTIPVCVNWLHQPGGKIEGFGFMLPIGESYTIDFVDAGTADVTFTRTGDRAGTNMFADLAGSSHTYAYAFDGVDDISGSANFTAAALVDMLNSYYVETNPGTPELTVTKTAEDADATLVNPSVGDVVYWTVTAKNTGSTDLTYSAFGDSLTVSSTYLGRDTDDNGTFDDTAAITTSSTLAAGQTWKWRVGYTLTSADIQGGNIENVASVAVLPAGASSSSTYYSAANGTASTSATAPSSGGGAIVNLNRPAITLVKAATLNDDDGTPGVSAGDTIDYSFTVTNTGNVTLTNITLTDPLITVSGGPISSLASSASDSTTFSGSYTLTQADINVGSVTNSATVTGSSPTGTNDVTDTSGTSGDNNTATVTSLTQVTAITGTKTSVLRDLDQSGGLSAGDALDYTITATNTGNLTLTSVAISSEVLSREGGAVVAGFGAGDFTAQGSTTLAPGASVDFTASYTVTQADIDAGGLSNTATVKGTPPSGPDISDVTDSGNANDGANDDDATDNIVTPAPAITLVKVGTLNDDDGTPGVSVGDSIDYSFTITNTGNVTLTNITLTDPLIPVSGGPISSLAPGASDSTTFSGRHILTLGDLNAGNVTNTATVTGSSPNGTNDVTDTSGTSGGNDTPTDTHLTPTAEITGTKTSVLRDLDQSGGLSAGDALDYTITATNTGNLTLTNVAISSEVLSREGGAVVAGFGAGDFTAQGSTTLAPGASVDFTASYTVTQADIDAGGLSNTATVKGTPPSGPDIEDVTDSGNANDGANDDDATVNTVTPAPGIKLVKTATLNDDDGTPGVSAGDTIDYSFAVTNTGNITLENISLEDPMFPGLFTATIPQISPGETLADAFSATYQITAADILRGNVPNQATVTGNLPGGGSTSDLSGTAESNDDATVTFLGSIGGTVREGGGTPRVGSWVRLVDSVTHAVIATLQTDSNGRYDFIGLPTGTYCVEFETPSGAGVRALDGDGEGAWSGDSVCGMRVEEGTGHIFDEVDAYMVDPSGLVYDSTSRLPLSGVTVRLLRDGVEVTDPSWYAAGSDHSGVVTGADGVYSFQLQGPAPSGVYSIEVTKDGYSTSTLIPAQAGPFDPGTGLGVVAIVPAATAPQVGDDTTYYLSFSFDFPDWTNASSLSKGVIHNHIAMDRGDVSAQLLVTKVADTSGLHSPARIGDVIRYTITAYNGGAFPLDSVSLDDPMTNDEALVPAAGVTDDGSIDPGETWVWTASITLDATSVNRDSIENLATVTATNVLNEPVLVESAPGTGNAVEGDGNGSPTVVTLGGLVDEIEADLKTILEDDLRVTIERISQTGSGYAKQALARLKQGEPESCGDQPDNGGDLRLSANDRQIVVEGSNERIVYDCARHEWRIDTIEGSLRSLDGFGDQAMLSYTHRRERFVDEDRLRGRFVGVYASRSDVTSSASGTINGLGLFGGIYGARRLSDDLFLDYYLGGAAGRHSFKLSFPRDISILAQGNYSYWAVFGGAALSGEFHMDDVRVTPRVGVDLAYAPGANVNVTASQAGRVENGSFRLDTVTSGRLFVELTFENDLAMAGDGKGAWDDIQDQWSLTPRLFCDSGNNFDLACGAGFDLGYGWVKEDGDRTGEVELTAERTGHSTYLALRYHQTRKFKLLNGQLEQGVSVSSSGKPSVDISYKAEF